MITADEMSLFVEWVFEKDEWRFDSVSKLWKQDHWKSRTTGELFDFWKKNRNSINS